VNPSPAISLRAQAVQPSAAAAAPYRFIPFTSTARTHHGCPNVVSNNLIYDLIGNGLIYTLYMKARTTRGITTIRFRWTGRLDQCHATLGFYLAPLPQPT
jgi:hypothetical protein